MTCTAKANDEGRCTQARQELGVYLLGAIEPARRALVERHLAACPQCRAELAALAGLPSLLRKVPVTEALRLAPDVAAPVPSPSLTVLARRVSGIRRRKWCLTAAAASIAGFAVAAGLHALFPAAVGTPAVAAPRWAVMAEGESRVTGAGTTIRYEPLPWGTEMEIQVTGIAAGTQCQLLVMGPAGQDVAAGGWTIAAGHQDAWYPASVPFQAASVRGFVVSAGGKILVTVRAR